MGWYVMRQPPSCLPSFHPSSCSCSSCSSCSCSSCSFCLCCSCCSCSLCSSCSFSCSSSNCSCWSCWSCCSCSSSSCWSSRSRWSSWSSRSYCSYCSRRSCCSCCCAVVAKPEKIFPPFFPRTKGCAHAHRSAKLFSLLWNKSPPFLNQKTNFATRTVTSSRPHRRSVWKKAITAAGQLAISG